MSPDETDYPIDRVKTFIYFTVAAVLLILLVPVVIFIHEMGHVIAILLLGGQVTEFHVGYSSGHVQFTGIESASGLFMVHLSGVLANVIVGAALIFHVWRYEGHPLVEAASLIWGVFLFLLDFINYTIKDIFGDHGGDFEKIYDAYPWSVPIFILVDILLVVTVIVLLTRKEFWQGIQLPRKKP
jgi:hypothetical protein